MGFWYMTVGDVVTAWTIALYIVTAAAGECRNPGIEMELT
jgi:hypothetical protein